MGRNNQRRIILKNTEIRNNKVIILMGLPASGKTTWAKKLQSDNPGMYKRINKDALREMLDCEQWSAKNEKMIVGYRNDMCYMSMLSGYNVIIDDTNFHPSHIKNITQVVDDYNELHPGEPYTIEIQRFDISVEEAIERDSKRPNPVGEKVIVDMAIRYLYNDISDIKNTHNTKYNTRRETPVPRNTGKPQCIVCDLDNTLVIMGDRSPYDASKCDEVDSINIAIKDILGMYVDTTNIILVSGREEKDRGATERFLDDNCVYYTKLYMRATNDNRKDSIVKKEIYQTHIEPYYDTFFWLDDRNQVVKMVREDLKIPCLQVNEGNF